MVTFPRIPLPWKLLGASIGALSALIGVLIIVASYFRVETVTEEVRLAHLDAIVKLLETYKQQHGVYPQPTARAETIEGFQHVWGYRADVPSLASCTIVLEEKTTAPGAPRSVEAPRSDEGSFQPDPLHSVCGGDIYDVEGRIIGWKGTLTAQSGLNNVEVTQRGGQRRLSSPLAELGKAIPIDPAYEGYTDLQRMGFGEYVYAVRAPKDGAVGRGGIQYQIATTIRDPRTGHLRTVIRGNYFVRSDERSEMPPSLIGPGVLYESTGRPQEGPTMLYHVLLDGQQEGYPNPLLGEGKRTIRILTIHRKASLLLQAVYLRRQMFQELLAGTSSSFERSLMEIEKSLETLLHALNEQRQGPISSSQNPQPPDDLVQFEQQLQEQAHSLEKVISAYLAQKEEEVRETLRLQIEEQERVERILSGALLQAETAHDFTLLARDELVKYLEGEGIEEQSRSRAGKKLESAMEQIPDLQQLFAQAGLRMPEPFLSQEQQKRLQELFFEEEAVLADLLPPPKRPGGVSLRTTVDPSIRVTAPLLSLRQAFVRASIGGAEEPAPLAQTGVREEGEAVVSTGGVVQTGTGQEVPLEETIAEEEEIPPPFEEPPVLPESAVMLTTVTFEIRNLFADLTLLLRQLQGDLRNPSIAIAKIDGNLRQLSRALTAEVTRIEELLPKVLDAETTARFLAEYEDILRSPPLEEEAVMGGAKTENGTGVLALGTGAFISSTVAAADPELLTKLREDRARARAIERAATFARLQGDFSSLLFPMEMLDQVILEKQPGIPDLTAHDQPWEAEYQGIPYPLP